MNTTLKVILAASLLAGCSSTPEATEAESTATAVATASADMTAPPETTAVASATAEPTPPPPEPAADLVVTPVKIVVDAKTTIEIKADKGIYFKAKKVATFDKNVLKLEGMDHHMTVWKDGTIEMKPPSPKKIRFNDKDEVELDNGGKIAIDDKGKVVMTPPTDKPQPKDFKPPTITGFKPEGRRAATLGVLLALMTESPETKPAPTAVEVPAPKSSAAPAKSAAPPTMK